MLDIRTWSFGKVVRASMLLTVLEIVAAAGFLFLWFYIQFRRAETATGSGGIHVSINLLIVLPIVFGPPIVLTAIWYLLRCR